MQASSNPVLLAGADIVLPDRVVSQGSLVIDHGRIASIEPRSIDTPSGASRVDLQGHLIVPGFVDVHVHGVEGIDVLDGPGAIAAVAARLSRYGVTAFCPTSIACPPDALSTMLRDLDNARTHAPPGSAKVLSAHLESNFINEEYKGAQPAACLRAPARLDRAAEQSRPSSEKMDDGTVPAFTAEDILDVIRAHRTEIGIITIAPELEGGLDLVRELTVAGHHVSIGHTGATYEQSLAAISEGVCHATHLFNRMTPMTHRAPGVPGAVLQSPVVTAEVVCDSFHVHPTLVWLAIQAKGAAGIMAITDGTAGSGLPAGSRTRLGGRPIVVTERTAELEDGTIAGSVLTMDGAFRILVNRCGVPLVDAARMCATTPAEHLRLPETGRIQPGAVADLVVLDGGLRVRETFVAGHRVGHPS